MRPSIAAFLTAVGMACTATADVAYPSIEEIQAAAATTRPLSPVSNVKGLAFDRFIQVWLENIVSDAVTAMLVAVMADIK